MKLVISEVCPVLVGSLAESCPAAGWQRCVVHFTRNVFGHVPATKLREMAHLLKAIHAHDGSSLNQAGRCSTAKLHKTLDEEKKSTYSTNAIKKVAFFVRCPALLPNGKK